MMTQRCAWALLALMSLVTVVSGEEQAVIQVDDSNFDHVVGEYEVSFVWQWLSASLALLATLNSWRGWESVLENL